MATDPHVEALLARARDDALEAKTLAADVARLEARLAETELCFQSSTASYERSLRAAEARVQEVGRERDHYRSNADWTAQELALTAAEARVKKLEGALRGQEKRWNSAATKLDMEGLRALDRAADNATAAIRAALSPDVTPKEPSAP